MVRPPKTYEQALERISQLEIALEEQTVIANMYRGSWRDLKAKHPIPMMLYCDACSALHVDEGEWATKPHKTHQCQECGNEWRPAHVPTVGVSSSLFQALRPEPKYED